MPSGRARRAAEFVARDIAGDRHQPTARAFRCDAPILARHDEEGTLCQVVGGDAVDAAGEVGEEQRADRREQGVQLPGWTCLRAAHQDGNRLGR